MSSEPRKNRWIRTLTVLGLICLLAAPAVASVASSQQPEIDIVVLTPDTDGNRRTSDLDVDRLLGDNFTLGTATTLRTVEFWGWYSEQDFDVDYLDDFTLEVYRIVGGSPEVDPVYSRRLGDIVENAVPSPFGGYLGDSPLVPHWSLVHNPGVPSALQIHRYVADLCDHPIELKAGDYLISIFNDRPEQGIYLFGDEVEFIGTGDVSHWNWHRAEHLQPAVTLDGFTWVRTSSGGWVAECTGTPCGSGDDLIRQPDLSFQLYDSRLGLEIVTGSAQPIVYTVGGAGGPFVHRVSNLRVGDAVYDVNFRINLPSVVFGAETDLDFLRSLAAADALNAVLDAAVPVPSRTQSTVGGEMPGGLEARVYSIPYFRSGTDTVSVESSGPAVPAISTWQRTLDASATDNQQLSLADFSLLDGQVEPFELTSGDLIAGGGNALSAVTVGSVRAVTANGSSFSLTYQITEPGWCLTEVHAHVADTAAEIPQTRSGNPKVGRFEYGDANVGCKTEYTVPGISLDSVAGNFAVAAHAVVVRQLGALTVTETAWGAGMPFPGRSWATYMGARLCE